MTKSQINDFPQSVKIVAQGILCLFNQVGADRFAIDLIEAKQCQAKQFHRAGKSILSASAEIILPYFSSS
jgi:hypothetical protein